ncbi:putative c2 domain protein [Histomonas meleagridis]|uniref:putative c2 domain protein n=1 Tax=Histomonas meleagridis TaxID=135588 RepID=UPI00355A0E3C|nr:putative c2 domain protein [Histomonas meleagridis]KAH0804879.1 putative c2 domain protein [Histomonas meleagridis]
MSSAKITVKVIEATNLIKIEKVGDPDPFVKVGLRSSDKTKKTKVISNTINPIWNESLSLKTKNTENDSLLVNIINKNVLVDTPMCDQIEIPIKILNFNGEPFEFDSDITFKNVFAGHIKMEIFAKLKDKDCKSSSSSSSSSSSDSHSEKPTKSTPKETQELICNFSFGSLSSSYSTDFTGYTEYSHSLSPIHSEEEKFHHHHDEITIKQTEFKPKPIEETLFVQVCRCVGLAKTDANGTDSYVKVSLVGKRKPKNDQPLVTEVAMNTEDPQFDQGINFPKVKKGESIVIEVFQKSKVADFQIGYLKIPVKEIEVGSKDEKEYLLQKPIKISEIFDKITDFGKIYLILDHQKKFKE